MARALRLEYEGAIYHVMSRGNRRQRIFRDDADRIRFLEKLEEAVERFHLRVFVYALMDNHYHLLAGTPRGNLSRVMQQFQTSYSSYFRTRHGFSGHVYGGRYKAPLVEGDGYLLALTRYVHLNPVRTRRWTGAPLSERRKALRAYRWSSYRGYLGLTKVPDWIDQRPLLDWVESGWRSYRDYVEWGLAETDEELKEAQERSGKAVGGEAFCAWVEDRYAELAEQQGAQEDVALRRREVAADPEAVLNLVCAACRVDEKDLVGRRGNQPERDVLMAAWRDHAGLSHREIGRRLGHSDGATVGKRLAAIRADPRMRNQVETAVRALHIANCKA